MSLKEKIFEFQKEGFFSLKPKPIFVFLLFFAYFLIWLVAFVLYLKYEMDYLKIWIIIVGILALLTLIHAIIHAYIVKILTNR